MKLTLENTAHMVTLQIDGVDVPARVWEGQTESGIYVQCMIVRIAVPNAANQEQFVRELKECRPPSLPSVFPLRMML